MWSFISTIKISFPLPQSKQQIQNHIKSRWVNSFMTTIAEYEIINRTPHVEQPNLKWFFELKLWKRRLLEELSRKQGDFNSEIEKSFIIYLYEFIDVINIFKSLSYKPNMSPTGNMKENVCSATAHKFIFSWLELPL